MDRKLPIRSKVLELDGEWEGWQFTARLNTPLQAVADIASGDVDRMMKGLARIVLAWNFVDEEGEPMPPPDEHTIGLLPMDLVNVISARFSREMAPPKN